MKIKNYTSSVPAITSINRIEALLVEEGATDVNKKYKNNKPIAISFLMVVDKQIIPFKLPAKVDAIFKLLYEEVKNPKANTKDNYRAQAERTAWKIQYDWVQLQLTMIKLEQAEFIELFLPHVYDYSQDQSFFEKMKKNNFTQLLAQNN